MEGAVVLGPRPLPFDGLATFDDGLVGRLHLGGHLGWPHIVDGAADDVFRSEPHPLGKGAVDELIPAGRVLDENGRFHGLDDRREQRLALAQGHLRPFLFGDVVEDGDDVTGPAVEVVDGGGRDRGEQYLIRPVHELILELDLARRPRCQPPQPLPNRIARIGMKQLDRLRPDEVGARPPGDRAQFRVQVEHAAVEPDLADAHAGIFEEGA